MLAGIGLDRVQDRSIFGRAVFAGTVNGLLVCLPLAVDRRLNLRNASAPLPHCWCIQVLCFWRLPHSLFVAQLNTANPSSPFCIPDFPEVIPLLTPPFFAGVCKAMKGYYASLHAP